MRKLGNTLYVTTPEAYCAVDGENVVILIEDKEAKRLPLHNLESIITFGYTGASPALMGACAERGIALTFLTASGRFIAGVHGKERGNVLLRKTQYRIADNESRSIEVAKYFIQGKLYNCKWVLRRAIRDHAVRLDTERLERVVGQLDNGISMASDALALDALRGIEGEAAARYYSVFDELILQQKDSFKFNGRNRRPPLDNVNALLSFAYTLLANDVASALTTVGLDPYVGFMHADRPGRISLALDMMEELRPIVADRFVITLINNKRVSAKDFTIKENGAVIMDDDARRTVLGVWQERKREIITHPYLNEKLEWGLVPYAQSLLLARYLRGDIDAYPPFLWK